MGSRVAAHDNSVEALEVYVIPETGRSCTSRMIVGVVTVTLVIALTALISATARELDR